MERGLYGIRDWVAIDRIRLLMIAEIGRHYSNCKVREWLMRRCFACDEHTKAITMLHKLAEEEVGWRRMEQAASRGSRT
jgi:hypothetical protein